MQGRASKAPKKELVIESPQQYKSLAAAEAEVDTVAQVVSHSNTYTCIYIYIVVFVKKISWLFKAVLIYKSVLLCAVLLKLNTIIKS